VQLPAATQVWLALHAGVAPPQSAPVRHCTQVSVDVSQTLSEPVQLVLDRQSTQRGTAVSQTLPAQPNAAVQTTHFFWVVSQAGVPPPQSPLETHPTQVVVEVSQTGVAPLHPVLSARQLTQVLAGPQTLAVPVQSVLVRQPTHAPPVTVVSQNFPPVQPAAAVQTTHFFAVVSQTGVPPEQSPVAKQSTQAVRPSHLRVPHPSAVVQTTQVWSEVSQMGFAPLVHWVAVTQSTHRPPVTLVSQARVPQPWAAVQTTQTFLAVSQTGVPTPQSLLVWQVPGVTQRPPATPVSQTWPPVQPAAAVQTTQT
jgi:hypothetical protein